MNMHISTKLIGLTIILFALNSCERPPDPPKQKPQIITFNGPERDSGTPQTVSQLDPNNSEATGPPFAAPGEEDLPLMNTHAVIEYFLKARDWQSQLSVIYDADELAPKIRAHYHSARPALDFSDVNFKMKLFQMELDPEFGGPFWVYQIEKSESDDTGGFPIIIREQDGELKIDWEVFQEFAEKTFVSFLDAQRPIAGDYRVVAEQISTYPESQGQPPVDLSENIIYEISLPYGGYRAHSTYAFVEKDTPLGRELDNLIAIGDDPLATILSLEKSRGANGENYFTIRDLLNEGWLTNKRQSE